MQIPFDFWNISLWFAVTGITLLITAQLASAYDGNATLLIDQKKLKNVALIIGMLFLVTLAICVYGIMTST